MDGEKIFTREELQSAKDSIEHAQGYKEKGLEAYAVGLNIPLETFKTFEGSSVLDLGAGAHLQFAQGLQKAGIKAFVTSFSPAFADNKWSTIAQETDVSEKRMVAGMGEHLPFLNASFQKIICLDVFEHLDTFDRYMTFLQEIVRVLAPGGIAYLGPTKESPIPVAGQAIPKEELEKKLKEVTVTYHTARKVLGLLTLTFEKKSLLKI